MKLRIGYGRDRKVFVANEQINFGSLKDNVRQLFSFGPDVIFVIKLGNTSIESSDDQLLTETGVVSGDLLLVEVVSGNAPPTSGNARNLQSDDQPMEMSEINQDFSLEIVQEVLMDKLCGDCQFSVKKNVLSELSDDLSAINIFFGCPINPWTQAHLVLYGFGQAHAKIMLHLISEKGNIKEFGMKTVYANGFEKDLKEFAEEVRQFLLGPYNKFLSTFFVGPVAGLAWSLCKYIEPASLLNLSIANRYTNDFFNRMSFDNRIWKEKFAEFSGKSVSDLPTPSEHQTYKKSLVKALREKRRCQRELEHFERRLEPEPLYSPTERRIFDPRGYRPGNPLDNFDDHWRGGEVLPSRPPRRDPANPLIIPGHGHPGFHPDFNPDPDMPQGPGSRIFPRRGDPGTGGGFFGPGGGFIG